MKFSDSLAEAITQYALEFGIPEDLARALVWVESSGRWEATRYEKNYRYLVGQPAGAEKTGQKTSWGPAQIMGAVAREYGFAGEFKTLLGPEGLHYGFKHLARQYAKYGSWDAAIRAYNTGRGSPTKAGNHYLAKIETWRETRP